MQLRTMYVLCNIILNSRRIILLVIGIIILLFDELKLLALIVTVSILRRISCMYCSVYHLSNIGYATLICSCDYHGPWYAIRVQNGPLLVHRIWGLKNYCQ